MNNDNLVGFRIICSLNKYKGIHSLSLGKSAEFYKKVEHFENVRLNSNGGWEGIECPLKTLPIQNLDGSYKTPPLKWFVLGKMYQDSNYVGLKLMDLNGDVFYKTLKECRELYDSDGFINVSVSDRDTMELDFIKGGIPTYPIKKKGSDRSQDNLKEYNIKENIPDRDYNITKDKNLTIVQKDIKKINKDVPSINKGHYIELATLFAKKEKGLVSDRDIADVVGARSPQEYSSKIKEYLGEPTTLSDSDVLKRLYHVYQQNVQKAEGDNVGMPMSVKGDKDIARMQELIDKLVPAAEAYYTGADEIMSNYEYDKLYNELEDLEKKTGIVLAGSLTQKVGFEVKSKLPKVKHATKMLSLDKTKDRQELANSLGGQEGFLGWKLDGCFVGHTKITMSDGSLKKIKDVMVGDEVLSYDFEKNELCKRKVINRFFNGYKLNSEWVKISTVSSSSVHSLKVTKNHLFYTPFGWKRADELNKGDIIYKNDSVLSESQISVIVGLGLGDGSIISRLTKKEDIDLYTSLEIRYSKVNKEPFLEMINKFETLFENYLGTVRKTHSGYNSEIYTRYLKHITSLPLDLCDKFNFSKTSFKITEPVLKYLTPLALAVYFIDDGYRGNCSQDGYNTPNKRNRATLSMYRYSYSEIELFSKCLLEKYGIETKIRQDRVLSNGIAGYVLDFSADSSEILFDLIAPYIPKSIRPFKLGTLDRWQNAPEINWWDDREKKGIIPRKIISYTELEDKKYSYGIQLKEAAYDLEIEGTHAYFAKGCLVHNCTTVFTYENGELISAVTRGNGSIGEDITHNAKFFAGVPQKISYKERLVVRGEALISRKNFEKINAQITNVDDKYKNARNLASGSIRQLDSKVAKERHVEVVAFTVVEGFDWIKTYTGKLEELRKYGFDIVPYIKVKPSEVIKGIEYFEDKVEKYKFPTDGLVITIDDIAYGEMLGNTAKFPRNSKAFKWKDEPEPTELIDIEWSVGRTGAITPVAIFKPVEIDGTTVQRASVHNVSVMKQLKLGKGDVVNIIKSNMIIPQVVENLTKSGTCVPPSVCPVCGGPTQIQISQQAEVLMCVNPNCVAKHIGNLSHFVERDAMNIDGLSEATLERFVNEGYIKIYRDIYHLSDYEKDIVKLDGFGRASYTKLIKAIDKSRECELPAFIYALGINQVGKRTAKDICQGLDYDLGVMLRISEDDLKKLPNIGDKTAHEFVNYMQIHGPMIIELTKELKFKAMQKINRNSPISGMTFCITGDVYQFKNRKELQALIESLGAKASSSVSAKTNYLINNDITSNSNKNQTAKKLGIPIISENDFLKMIGR